MFELQDVLKKPAIIAKQRMSVDWNIREQMPLRFSMTR